MKGTRRETLERNKEARALWRRIYAVAKRRGCADWIAEQDANEAVQRYKRRFS